MEKKKILKKAFAKAVKAGWELTSGQGEEYTVVGTEEEGEAYTRLKVKLKGSKKRNFFMRDSEMTILSHGFAKAFWGKDSTIRTSHNYPTYRGTPLSSTWNEIPVWKFHLQQMVLEEDPIKYLEKFL